MNKYVVLLLSLLVCTVVQAESYFYAGVGLGKNTVLFGNPTIYWDDDGSMGNNFAIGYRHDLSDSFLFYTNYTHYSQLFTGPPFNNKSETSSDHFMLGIEWKFWKKQ